jgi:single-strand DNA-binding protein
VTRAAGGGGQSRGQVSDEPWSTPGTQSAPAASSGGDSWAAPGAYGDDTPF